MEIRSDRLETLYTLCFFFDSYKHLFNYSFNKGTIHKIFTEKKPFR